MNSYIYPMAVLVLALPLPRVVVQAYDELSSLFLVFFLIRAAGAETLLATLGFLTLFVSFGLFEHIARAGTEVLGRVLGCNAFSREALLPLQLPTQRRLVLLLTRRFFIISATLSPTVASLGDP